MQSSLEKYASEAYELVVKKASEQSTTYAGDGFKRGIIGGAAAGVGVPLYNWAAKGIKPALGAGVKSTIATAAMWGIAGGLGGGIVKKKPQDNYSCYSK